VPFNIPIFEIFVKKNYEAPSTNLFYIDDMELTYPESSFDEADRMIEEDRKEQRKEAYRVGAQ